MMKSTLYLQAALKSFFIPIIFNSVIKEVQSTPHSFSHFLVLLNYSLNTQFFFITSQRLQWSLGMAVVLKG